MPCVNITLPVYNEEAQLASSVEIAEQFLKANVHFESELVIADNGSTDGTLAVARELEHRFMNVKCLRLPEKGRGRALREVWLASDAGILSYMDVDLSTDLAAFPLLIAALSSGGFDLAVGSRLLAGSQTTRCWKREIISRGYNRLIHSFFGTGFSDAQCGFKAITRAAADRLLPLIEDNGWFFDTELLVLAERYGYRIFDLPVRWTEDPDSRVKIPSTAWADLKGLWRVWRNLRRGRYAGLAAQTAPPDQIAKTGTAAGRGNEPIRAAPPASRSPISLLKNPPGEGTGPTRPGEMQANPVGRVPSRGVSGVSQQPAKDALRPRGDGTRGAA